MDLNFGLNTAWQLFQKGEVVKALQQIEQLVKIYPNSFEARQLLGICYAQQGNDQAADAAFQYALKLAPNHPQILSNQATLRRRQNRLEDAINLWRSAITIAPKFTQAWLDLGLTELKVGKFKQAIASLQQAILLNEKSALAWHGLGNAHRSNGDLNASEMAFKNAVAIEPRNGSAWLNLGSVQRLLGSVEESLLSYENARKSGFESPQLSDATLGALLDNGQVDLALNTARQLVNKYPDYVEGHNSLANILWEYGSKYAPGIEPLVAFREAVLKQPNHKELQISYAAFLIKAQQSEVALQHIQTLTVFKDHPEFMLLQADAYENLGAQEQASKLYSRLYQIPEMRVPSFLNAYTRHLLKAGLYDNAGKYAQESIKLDQYNQEAWAYLSTIWRLQADAREYWLCDYDHLISLQEIEVPKSFSDLESYLLALRSTLEPMHAASHAPVQQSLRKGSQTSGRLFGRKNQIIEAAQFAMRQTVQRWIKTLPDDSKHPFLSRKAKEIRFSGSWSVKLWSSGSHVNHIHSEGWMSSAFYVALPSSVTAAKDDNPSGYIQFGQPLAELNLGLNPRRYIKPEVGKLALFPSYMWHGTVPFVDDEPRISIAFDMQPNP